MKDYLAKAKEKYEEYSRGYEYQQKSVEVLFVKIEQMEVGTEEHIETMKEIEHLLERKRDFHNKMIALEDVFGMELF